MRFRSRRPTRVSFRSDRSRLVRLVLGLILVIAGIQVAADPATWSWFVHMDRDPATVRRDEGESYPVQLQEVLPRDGLDAPGSGTPGGSDEAGRLIDAAGVAAIQDDTLGLRAAERPIVLRTLLRLRDPATPQRAADPSGTFPVVMAEPAHYRGRSIPVSGTARRILPIPAGPNDAGLETLFELWIFTPESGNNPWRILALDLPKGLPRGESLDPGVPVRLTGVFFKRQGYETARHELHVAPLLLAGAVSPVVRAARTARGVDLRPWLLGAAVLAGAACLLLFWRVRRADRAFERRILSRFDATGAAAAVSPADDQNARAFFRQLEETESQP